MLPLYYFTYCITVLPMWPPRHTSGAAVSILRPGGRAIRKDAALALNGFGAAESNWNDHTHLQAAIVKSGNPTHGPQHQSFSASAEKPHAVARSILSPQTRCLASRECSEGGLGHRGFAAQAADCTKLWVCIYIDLGTYVLNVRMHASRLANMYANRTYRSRNTAFEFFTFAGRPGLQRGSRSSSSPPRHAADEASDDRELEEPLEVFNRPQFRFRPKLRTNTSRHPG